MSLKNRLKKIGPCLWELPKEAKSGMKVPAWLFLSESLLKQLEEGAIEQAANIAFLPGIYKHSIALPDMHFGYGFPIGGVAALDYENGGLSPGGIGFDINCGVRLLRTNLFENQIKSELRGLIESIFRNVPSGVGRGGKLRLSFSQLNDVLVKGAAWAVENGYGKQEDLEHLEENGSMKTANPDKVSDSARKRGASQLGTLGAGNHFLEIQKVGRIFSPEIAKKFGIEREGQVMVMIHTGSRGFGHQVCTDYLRILENRFRDMVRKLPDRELIYAPSGTKECDDYFQAMSCAVNYAFCNRQMITHWVREALIKTLKMKEEDIGLEIVYGVCHNVGKVEEHDIDGKMTKVYLHRKGATRCFPAGNPEIPGDYRDVGQPVLIPGTMSSASYVLVASETAKETFYSTAHGAGRVLSRTKATNRFRGREIAERMAQKGILSRSASWRVMAEEATEAYKDIDEVVRVTQEAGISKIVAKMIPLGVVKG